MQQNEVTSILPDYIQFGCTFRENIVRAVDMSINRNGLKQTSLIDNFVLLFSELSDTLETQVKANLISTEHYDLHSDGKAFLDCKEKVGQGLSKRLVYFVLTKPQQK